MNKRQKQVFRHWVSEIRNKMQEKRVDETSFCMSHKAENRTTVGINCGSTDADPRSKVGKRAESLARDPRPATRNRRNAARCPITIRPLVAIN